MTKKKDLLTKKEREILKEAARIMAKLSHKKSPRPREFYQRIQAMRKTHGRQKKPSK